MAQNFTIHDTKACVGDTVRIHQEISEGEKTRTQIFEGIIIAIKGRENGQSFTIRRIGVGGIGIEKILPVQLPSIKKIEVKRAGKVRRSKLYFLRERIGKAATKVKEKATVVPTGA
jgi:large subunit ribosomal protein L19